MRIAVTGASGFVGSHVTRALTSAGHEVVALARGKRKQRRRAGVTWVRADVTSEAGLEEAFRDVDVVVHLSAIRREKGHQTFDLVNRVGAQNVAQAAQRAGVGHLIHLSGVGADPAAPSPFLTSKWEGEQAVRAANVPHTILRASLIFGPGDEFFTTLTRIMRKSPAAVIIGSGNTLFQPISVDDVVRCITELIQHGPRETMIEVGGPDHLSMNQISAAIRSALGLHRIPVHVPLPLVAAVATLTSILPNPPVTKDELKLLNVNNITRRDTVMVDFGFQPKRFATSCDYLNNY